jgi:predicted RNase H-like HicB family nuclease
MTRDEAIDSLNEVFVVLATTSIRGIPTEVELGREDGMSRDCVLNADHTDTVAKGYLVRANHGAFAGEGCCRLRCAEHRYKLRLKDLGPLASRKRPACSSLMRFHTTRGFELCPSLPVHLWRRTRGIVCRMSEQLDLTIVYEPGEDGGVIASIPEVAGVFSQGRTREEARESVIDALRLMLSPEPGDANDRREREALHLTIAA